MEGSFGDVVERMCSSDHFKGKGWVLPLVVTGFGENRKPFFIASAALKPFLQKTLKSPGFFIQNRTDAVLQHRSDLGNSGVSESTSPLEAMVEQAVAGRKVICMLSNNENGEWDIVCFAEA
jgi:hypothetical protein